MNTLKPVEENFEEDFTCELTKSTETKQYENHPDTVKVITEKMEEENVNFSESNLISKQIQTEKRQHQRKSKPTENELEETLHQLENAAATCAKKYFPNRNVSKTTFANATTNPKTPSCAQPAATPQNQRPECTPTSWQNTKIPSTNATSATKRSKTHTT